MNKILLTGLLIAITSFNAISEILWEPTQSTYDGNSFISVSSGKGRTASSTAFGNGITENSEYKFALANTSIETLPSFSQSDISATEVPKGTTLVLTFSKSSSDKISFLAITANASKLFKLEILSDTSFKITALVENPASSPNGNANVAFGFILGLVNDSSNDYGKSVFVTDIHYLDLATITSSTSGRVGIRGIAVNGGLASLTAFIPTNFLSSLGINDATELMGFVDENQVNGNDFKNEGVFTNLGFNFNDSNNPTNSLVKAKIDNYDWSSQKSLLFGTFSDSERPTLKIRGKKKIKTKKKKVTISGTTNDNFEVVSVKYFTKRRRRNLKEASLQDNFWTFNLKRLKKGKRVIVRIFATDTSNLESKIRKVRVTRRK